MEIKEAIYLFQQNVIKEGNTISITAQMQGTLRRYPRPAPYYFCQEEEFFYSFCEIPPPPYLTKIVPLIDSSVDLNNNNNYNDFAASLQLIPFGLDDAIDIFALSGEPEIFEPDTCDIQLTGKVMVPLNSMECRFPFGIGYLSMMQLSSRYDKDKLQLKTEIYDPRPVICLYQFSASEREKIVTHVLKRTKMEFNDFCWYLDGPPEGQVKANYWITVR